MKRVIVHVNAIALVLCLTFLFLWLSVFRTIVVLHLALLFTGGVGEGVRGLRLGGEQRG